MGRRTTRDAEHSFVVEGAKLLGEALSAGVAVESVFVDTGLLAAAAPQAAASQVTAAGASTAAAPEAAPEVSTVQRLVDQAYATGSRVYELEPGVLGRIADTVTPQPVLAIVPKVDVGLEGLGADLVVVCVEVRDPGNAGTVIRSAEAAGAGGVVFCEGSVDVFNPKTVRASAGALFHVPVVCGGSALEVLGQLGRAGWWRLGTTPRGGQDYACTDLSRPVALVLGNEAHGLRSDLEAVLDATVTIPIAGKAESINVGMAAAVLCFEASRQRRQPRPPRLAPGPAV
jgi:RNA methyltransferase, TrmH family